LHAGSQGNNFKRRKKTPIPIFAMGKNNKNEEGLGALHFCPSELGVGGGRTTKLMRFWRKKGKKAGAERNIMRGKVTAEKERGGAGGTRIEGKLQIDAK